MKKRLLLVILFFAVVHVALLVYDAKTRTASAIDDEAQTCVGALERVARTSDPTAFFTPAVQRLLRVCVGRSPGDPAVLGQVAHVSSNLPSGSCEIAFYDANERLLWAQPRNSVSRPVFERELGTGYLRSFGVIPPLQRSGTNNAIPGRLALWHAVRPDQCRSETIASVLLIIDVSRFSGDSLLIRKVLSLRRRGLVVGWWNRVDSRLSSLPAGTTVAGCERMLSTLQQAPDSRFEDNGRRLVAVPVNESLILLGAVSQPVPIPSTAGVILLIAWLVPALWSLRSAHAERVGLVPFLMMALGIAAGIPLALAALLFWPFLENRMASRTNDILQEMAGRLVHIDNQFPSLLRQRKEFYLRHLRAMARDDAGFRREMATFDALEMRGWFDSFFLVRADGESLRDYSNLNSFYRGFFSLPVDQRRTALSRSVTFGRIPLRPEVELILSLGTAPADLPRLQTLKYDPAQSREILRAIGILGRVIIDAFRARHQADQVGAPKGDDTANLVYSGLVDSGGGNVTQNFLADMGVKFGRLQSGDVRSLTFAQVLQRPNGDVTHAAFVFHDLPGLEATFLNRVFSCRQKWPANIGYFARSSRLHAQFPDLDARRLFGPIANQLLPPRRQLTTVTHLDGRKVLLAAFSGRNLEHYMLIATRPYSLVERERDDLMRQATGVGMLLALLLLHIAWRIYWGVIVPAESLQQGIRAMEGRVFDHRVPTGTDDEFDDIARTFNQTLEGMEELEVARFIQTRLLPQGVIRSSAGTFLARSTTAKQVGGDYFDAVAAPDGSLVFVMGDVTGHGVSAALVVAMAKSAFHLLIKSGMGSPAALLDRINLLFLKHLKKIKLMTCQIGRLTTDGHLSFANAGHPFPYLIQPDGRVAAIRAAGFPVGTTLKHRYTNVEIDLPRNARLVMYSDGIAEAMGLAGEEYTIQRLEKSLETLGRLEADALLTGIHAELRRYTGRDRWDDDVTLVVVDHMTDPAAPT